MPRRARIETDLPDEVRKWLDRALADGNFSGYERLESLLRERGFGISKSAIHRYGAKLERRLAAVKASTEAMKLLDEASGDERDSRSSGLMALIQTELFETIVNLQEATGEDVDPAERVKMLSNAAKNIATLSRASVNVKRFQVEAEERGREALLAEQRAKLAAMGERGVSAGAIADIRAALGIVG